MKVKWSLAELQKSPNGMYPISGQADLTNGLKSRKPDITAVGLVDVNGTISIEGKQRYYVDLTLNVNLTLPSSRSLDPVELDLEIPFHEVYLAPDVRVADLEDIDEVEVFSLEKDILDLQKPIEDTILASIPMKILSEEEQLETDLPTGHDWQVMLEDNVDKVSSSDTSTKSKPSPFDVLKDLDLFDEEDEEK